MLTKLLLILLLISTNFSNLVVAGEVLVDGQTVVYDDKLSLKDFTGVEFINGPQHDFSNKVIYGTVFSQQEPDSVIFPKETENVTFVCCHTDNVVLPKNSTVNNANGTCGSRLRYKVQNDYRAWEIDKDNKPLKLIDDEQYWIEKGVSVDPKDIPPVKYFIDKRKTLEENIMEIMK